MSLTAAKLPEDASTEEAAWIPIWKAAMVMRMSVGHLRRLCTHQYRSIGLARKAGGAWQIHLRADRRLRSDVHNQVLHDREVIAQLAKSGVSSDHIDLAVIKRDIVCGLSDFSAPHCSQSDRMVRYVAHLRANGTLSDNGISRLSVRTLHRWVSAYERGGIGLLIRSSQQRSDAEVGVGTESLTYIENLVNCGNRISLNTAITMARGEAVNHPDDPAWRIRSYSTIRMAIAARRPKILRVLSDSGERSAKALCVPKGHRDFEDLSTNQQWVGDERTLDVMIRTLDSRGWRPARSVKITAWMDMRSRVLTGWIVEEFADSATILGALKIGCKVHGVPSCLLVDWGQDYKKATGGPNTRLWKKYKRFDGQRIAGVLDELGIEVRPVLPYTPWSKPIESFFNTMKEHLDKFFASFWGGCPAERHEDRHKWVKANLEKLPTLEDLRKAIATFADTYHRTPHGAVDMFSKTPLQAFEAFVGEEGLRRESDTVLDYLFQTFVGPKLVRRDGVRHNNSWYGHGDPRLVALQGKKVLLGVQPDDAGRAMVCEVNDDRTPLFQVECAPLKGFTQRDAADRAKLIARNIRPYREIAKRGRKFIDAMTPQQRLDKYAAGVKAVHGKGDPEQRTSPNLRIRPQLEESIAAAGPAPSDDLDEASTAIRTGTDDEELDLNDLINTDTSLVVPESEDDDEGITIDDLIGEQYD